MSTQRRWSARLSLLFFCAIGLSLCYFVTPAAAFTGALSSADFSLEGTGRWFNHGTTSIEWAVSQNRDDSWHYAYNLSHPFSFTRYLILETADNFTADDVFNAQGDFLWLNVGDYGRDRRHNPNLPGDLYGIKFRGAWGRSSSFEFDSFRAPTWGDFYARGWSRCRNDTAWNEGFTANDTDPAAPAADGTIENHLLVPDSGLTAIPEPSALLLLGTGLLAAYAVRRKLT